MSLGLVGRKVGMTRVFTDDGDSIPVTVVDVSNNRVTQIKTVPTDGYTAVQVAFGKRRANRVAKPAAGHFAKAGVEAGRVLQEFRITPDQAASLKAGGVVGVDIFQIGQKVGDYTRDFTSIFENGISHRTHQSETSSTINQANATLGHRPAQFFGNFGIDGVSSGAGTTINNKTFHS